MKDAQAVPGAGAVEDHLPWGVYGVNGKNTSTDSAVTVVMATRNRRVQTLETLTHLVDLPERPAVIVVDNGSDDGTAQAVSAAFPEVTVLALARNLGAVARTVGVQHAGTQYVAFADDDSWWAPGALTRAAGYFDEDPSLALVAARILLGTDERRDPVCDQMSLSPLPPVGGRPSVLGFIACGAVVRREAYLSVGGFHPVVFFLGEETVLAQDLAAAGWHLVYAEDVVAHHHPRPGREREGRTRLQSRNALLSLWLRRPVLLAVGATVRQAVSRDSSARGAVVDAMRRLPQAMSHRRLLPANVERHVRLLEKHEP